MLGGTKFSKDFSKMDKLSFSLPGSTTMNLPIDDNDGSVTSFSEISADLDFLDKESQKRIYPSESAKEVFVPKVLGHKNWLFESIKESLTVRQWQAFELYVVYGYNQEQIARILGLSHKAVVSITLSRCIRRIRKRFGPMLESLLSRKESLLYVR